MMIGEPMTDPRQPGKAPHEEPHEAPGTAMEHEGGPASLDEGSSWESSKDDLAADGSGRGKSAGLELTPAPLPTESQLGPAPAVAGSDRMRALLRARLFGDEAPAPRAAPDEDRDHASRSGVIGDLDTDPGDEVRRHPDPEAEPELADRIGRFRGQSSFRTYLFGVAHNVLRSHLRKRRREGERFEPGVTSVFDLGLSPTTLIAQRKEQLLVLQALRRVPLDHQVVLELYYWEAMTAKELAEVLEIPEGTVRGRIRRAKQLLEEQLAKLAETDDLESTMSNLDNWARSLRAKVLESKG